jgi:hypothetical protein
MGRKASGDGRSAPSEQNRREEFLHGEASGDDP